MPERLSVATPGRALVNITRDVEGLIAKTPAKRGVVHLFIQHTSASFVVQENADPDVQRDLIDYFDAIAPENGPYRHVAEGPDDMPAHIKSALTATSISIPFEDGRLLLGTWQGVYVFEHRRAPQVRRVIATVIRAD